MRMYFVNSLLVFGATLGVSLAGSSSKVLSPRVVGGQPISKQDLSFIANIESIDYTYTGKNCSGALVDERLVITTANCLMTSGLTWFDPSLMTVSLSARDQYKVHQAVISDSYNRDEFSHNVGLVVLASPVPRYVARPAKIFAGSVGPSTQVHAAGFGSIGNRTHPSHPHTVAFTVSDQENCQVFKQYDPETQLCVIANEGKGLCEGDEGAPLLVSGQDGMEEMALVGLASYTVETPGEHADACSGKNHLSYFETSRYWASWVSKTAHVTFHDVVVALNITTDENHSSADGTDLWEPSDGVVEGPLSGDDNDTGSSAVLMAPWPIWIFLAVATIQ